MGRAIVRDPKVFLFDEPLSNLDAKLRIQVRTAIKELHQRLATTTVLVAHDQIEAMTLAGRVEQTGRPLELYDRLANTFVATFIGAPSMNLFEGTWQGGISSRTAVCASGCRTASRRGRRVVLGVRPKHLALDDAGHEARIAVVEPTGTQTMLFLKIDGQDAVASFRDRREFRPGETIRLVPGPERVHLFDAESGARIG